MKFIHTSDWHIGRYFHNVSLLDDQAFVLQQLIDYLEQDSVDALIIAGDIYDRAVPPAPAVALLNDTLATISQMGVAILIIPGNHDSASRLGFCSAPLKKANIHIFDRLEKVAQGLTLTGRSGIPVTFYGLPYAQPTQSLEAYGQALTTHQDLLDYQLALIDAQSVKPPNKRVIISHHFVAGGGESESERPLAVGGSDRVSADSFAHFDYVALGHLHRAQACRYDTVRYSGSPLKYSFSEANNSKSFTLVELQENHHSITCIPLQPKRDVAIKSGFFTDIMEQARKEKATSGEVNEDFYLIRLENREPLLNVMEQLQVYYPNLLHIERTPAEFSKNQLEHFSNKKQLSEFDLFKRFYQDMTGDPLSPEQEKAMSSVMDEILHEGLSGDSETKVKATSVEEPSSDKEPSSGKEPSSKKKPSSEKRLLNEN